MIINHQSDEVEQPGEEEGFMKKFARCCKKFYTQLCKGMNYILYMVYLVSTLIFLDIPYYYYKLYFVDWSKMVENGNITKDTLKEVLSFIQSLATLLFIIPTLMSVTTSMMYQLSIPLFGLAPQLIELAQIILMMFSLLAFMIGSFKMQYFIEKKSKKIEYRLFVSK